MPTPALSSPGRFRDPGHWKHHFAATGSVLVRCPRCERQARVVTAGGTAEDTSPSLYDTPRRLVCRHCGLSRERRKDVPIAFFWGGATDMLDPYFHVPLWLQTDTRHGRLWAYNPEHLDLLRRYVEATLREHDPWYEPWRKMGVIGRLPAWIKQAKNRDEVLRGLDRMRGSLAK
ncbi:hypothetical protein [Streptomyces albireticuli]|uniref:TFIIB-type zinc ribbon-containing protein n=1 Tax=Streptomyces albireticuli TaxID=1940 RepID=A0A2A2DES1_9ACTN|nr:hypothetical protein [Streptomyces albireticuli]MCD9194764.1 hypothetical protein [Streptomyces albireticuli]PAU49991.1 hypothetical protein CK936_04890 [Streptomyces albireticuli]